MMAQTQKQEDPRYHDKAIVDETEKDLEDLCADLRDMLEITRATAAMLQDQGQ